MQTCINIHTFLHFRLHKSTHQRLHKNTSIRFRASKYAMRCLNMRFRQVYFWSTSFKCIKMHAVNQKVQCDFLSYGCVSTGFISKHLTFNFEAFDICYTYHQTLASVRGLIFRNIVFLIVSDHIYKKAPNNEKLSKSFLKNTLYQIF